MEDGDADTSRKQFRTKEERLAIVEETLKPEISVAKVALAHGVNANQIFHWRRQYREGWFDTDEKKHQALVPVRVDDAVPAKGSRARTLRLKNLRAQNSRTPSGGTIDIDFGDVRVRIEGAADPECVRVMLEGLRR